MNTIRRDLRFIEDDKITPIPRAREETSSSILSFGRDIRTELTLKEAQPTNIGGILPPPSFAFSATAHKQRLFKGTSARGEDSKSDIDSRSFNEVSTFNKSVLNNTSTFKEQSECSVTVFGYPSTHNSQVLKEMERCGKIVTSQDKGKNWMHIRYSNPLEADVALKMHGMIINSLDLMIGVKKCEDRDFFNKSLGNRYNESQRMSPTKTYYLKRTGRSWLSKVIEHIFNW